LHLGPGIYPGAVEPFEDLADAVGGVAVDRSGGGVLGSAACGGSVRSVMSSATGSASPVLPGVTAVAVTSSASGSRAMWPL